jgi:hypothetical protein
MNPLDFMCGGGEAGAFTEAAYPKKEGRYPYEPYRSGSHHRMVTAIKEVGFAEIEFEDEGTLRRAKVTLPEYGILDFLSFT